MLRQVATQFKTLAFLVALSAPAQQTTTTLRIRILNARTNQPVADECLNVALAADQISSVALPTSKTGILLLSPTQTLYS